jgi:hypothetical protein
LEDRALRAEFFAKVLDSDQIKKMELIDQGWSGGSLGLSSLQGNVQK